LVTGFSDMRSDSTGIHAMCLCKCQEVCVVDAENTSACMRSANVQVFGGIIDMWSSILCAKPQDSSWHKKECLLGESALIVAFRILRYVLNSYFLNI